MSCPEDWGTELQGGEVAKAPLPPISERKKYHQKRKLAFISPLYKVTA